MKNKLFGRYIKVIASYFLGHPLYSPDSISIIVSDRCNLKCIMCDFWKDNKQPSEGISLDEFKKLFADLKKYNVRMVQLTGGEPFLRGDLFEILECAKTQGLETALVTNGTLINEKNVLRFARNIDLVYVSLDSPVGSQHENIRGVGGIFEKISRSVTLLTDTIKNNRLPARVIFTSTITPESIHEPEKMVTLAKKLMINGIIYNPASSVYYGNTTLKSNRPKTDTPGENYDNMINKIISLMDDPRNLIRSNPFYLNASKEFLKGNKKFYKFHCFSGGYNGPLIGFDGTVFPCCAWNTPLGNIRQEPFSRIWNSKLTQETRKKIKKGQCPVCYHHTRTFDFILRAPFLSQGIKNVISGYKKISRL